MERSAYSLKRPERHEWILETDEANARGFAPDVDYAGQSVMMYVDRRRAGD